MPPASKPYPLRAFAWDQPSAGAAGASASAAGAASVSVGVDVSSDGAAAPPDGAEEVEAPPHPIEKPQRATTSMRSAKNFFITVTFHKTTVNQVHPDRHRPVPQDNGAIGIANYSREISK